MQLTDGSKHHATGWIGKIVAIVLLPAVGCLVWGCAGNNVLEIRRILFGRECIAVELNRAAAVRQIMVYSGSEEVATLRPSQPEKNGALSVLDCTWRPGREYRIEVAPADGSPLLTASLQSPCKPSPVVIASFEMEKDVEPRGLRAPGYLGGRVAVSADGAYAAVGTEKSRLRVYDVAERRRLWSTRIGEGRILAMQFASGGRCLLVGEQSRDARITCFDTFTGKELWKYRTADDVGEMEGGEPLYRWPVVTAVAALDGRNPSDRDRCCATAARSFTEGGEIRTVSKLYAFDTATGKLLWTHPPAGAMDASPSILATDRRGDCLLFNNYRISPVCGKAVYCLDAGTGAKLWEWELEPLFPGGRNLIWHGLGISPDGSRVAAFSQDGRAFFLDYQELLDSGGSSGCLWKKEMSSPIDVNGMRLIGYGAVAAVTDRNVLFMTGSTIVQRGARTRTLIEHPNADTLFVYSPYGRLEWMYKAGGLSCDLSCSRDGRYVVLGVEHTYNEKDTSRHGVYVFDSLAAGGGREKLAWFFNTEGACLSAAISADGRTVAAIEYPLDVDPRPEFRDVRGAHRFYLLR